jgi:flagellar biosynthetic protein FliP
VADRLISRLPKGRDGRPLRARHRLLLAALLVAAFAVSVGPAIDSVRLVFGMPAASSTAPEGAAPALTAGPSGRPVYGGAPALQAAPAAPAPAVPTTPAAPAAPTGLAAPTAGGAATLAVPSGAPTSAAVAVAAQPAAPARPAVPAAPAAPAAPGVPTPTVGPGGVGVTVDSGTAGRNQVIQIIILMTVLSIAPSLLLLCTSFTKIAVVLSLTRNALGTPTIPPNQVLAGLALFLSLFVMSPVISQMNELGVQPYVNNQINEQQALEKGGEPLRLFMADHTGDMELQTMIKMSKSEQPKNKRDTSFTTLIPAFILSELKSAFIIGFVVFIPFLVIDLVVSSVLMSMGMMMLPPVMISLPFKLLLFVMVDGWSLITTALVTSYR